MFIVYIRCDYLSENNFFKRYFYYNVCLVYDCCRFGCEDGSELLEDCFINDSYVLLYAVYERYRDFNFFCIYL